MLLLLLLLLVAGIAAATVVIAVPTPLRLSLRVLAQYIRAAVQLL